MEGTVSSAGIRNNGFRMKFDKNTIDHLGIKLYSALPPVIAEVISNSYDAEANNVNIYINYSEKEISVEDDGHGMSHDDLNNAFLIIGRNRRTSNNSGMSKNGLRKVTGKKGLGKLAIFGIARTVEVISVENGVKNAFSLNYDSLKTSTDEEYKPEIISENEPVRDKNGTVIKIKEITQDSITNIQSLADSLSKRFSFYDDEFIVNIFDVSDMDNPVTVDRKRFFELLEKEFTWKFPENFAAEIEDAPELKYLLEKNITGEIYTKKTPLQKKDTGFILYARGKLAADNAFFNDRSNDQFNSYVTGFFNIDFIDDDNVLDFIGTARQSVLWDQNSDIKNSREHLNKLINLVSSQWRKKRAENKEREIISLIPDDLYNGMNSFEKDSLKKIYSALIKNSTNNEDASSVIAVLQSVKSMYQFESFREYVVNLKEEEITLDNVEKITSDWELIETKELAKIAIGRIEAINTFESYIKNNASETKLIQPFLEKFPWILDPRITTFEREKTYSSILKERFPDEKLDEPNRRIDFLCNAINGQLMIIELKRPRIKISMGEIEQVMDYKKFIEDKYRETFPEGISAYLISDRYDMDDTTKRIAKSLEDTKELKVLSYSDLLSYAKKYNSEFIEQYNKIKEMLIVKS